MRNGFNFQNHLGHPNHNGKSLAFKNFSSTRASGSQVLHTSLKIKMKSKALRTPTNCPLQKSQRGAKGIPYKLPNYKKIQMHAFIYNQKDIFLIENTL